MGLFDIFKKKPAPESAPSTPPESAAPETLVTASPAPVSPRSESSTTPAPTPSPAPSSKPSPSKTPPPSSTDSEGLFRKIGKAFAGKDKIDADFLDELEEILIRSDIGVKTTLEVIGKLEERVARDRYVSRSDLQTILKQEMGSFFTNGSTDLFASVKKRGEPYIIMVVGVNGVGKTTSIGKLAHNFKEMGLEVLLGAADTFRAAAVEQLVIWSERAGVPIIQQGQNADPAAVAFDTVQASVARNADVVLIDTAGRLHNKKGLMEELGKIKRVMSKVIPDAPHEVLLVLDASTGQNAIQQAKAFKEAVEITGLILTKLDGTAKGGIVFAIAHELGLPVHYIGIGEGIDDLRPFDPALFVEAILAE